MDSCHDRHVLLHSLFSILNAEFLVFRAEWVHLFPYRTEQLSTPAPMVPRFFVGIFPLDVFISVNSFIVFLFVQKSGGE